jgi:hypothetical protein
VTAVSKEAGKLEISVDLRRANQQYQGELVTPVGRPDREVDTTTQLMEYGLPGS